MATSNIVPFTVHMKPSAYLKRMRAHSGDLSESSKGKVLAKRTILGKKVTFYTNGLREVADIDLSEEDEFNSEILRLAHASILINEPVGDKEACYVDSSFDPVQIFVWGMPVDEFLSTTKEGIQSGKINKDFVFDSPLRETKEFSDGRNVRLFRG
jgi:hypothetical protein